MCRHRPPAPSVHEKLHPAAGAAELVVDDDDDEGEEEDPEDFFVFSDRKMTTTTRKWMFDVINSVVFHPPAPIYFTPTPPLVLCVAVLMFGDYFPASALPSNNTFRGLDQRGL